MFDSMLGFFFGERYISINGQFVVDRLLDLLFYSKMFSYFHSIHRTKWGYDTWHPETFQLHQRTIKPFDPKKNTFWLPHPTLRLGGLGGRQVVSRNMGGTGP